MKTVEEANREAAKLEQLANEWGMTLTLDKILIMRYNMTVHLFQLVSSSPVG
jgi:hypothetical protein